jgi:hypothetical protein
VAQVKSGVEISISSHIITSSSLFSTLKTRSSHSGDICSSFLNLKKKRKKNREIFLNFKHRTDITVSKWITQVRSSRTHFFRIHSEPFHLLLLIFRFRFYCFLIIQFFLIEFVNHGCINCY